MKLVTYSNTDLDFPGNPGVKNPPRSAGDVDSSLVWEYRTCHGATKFLHHNQWAHVRQLPKPMHPRAMLHRKGSHRNEQPEPRNSWGAPAPQLETVRVQQQRPSTARNKQ